MPWSILYIWWTVLLSVALSSSMQLPPIHWNSSNPMFKTSNNDHIVEVQLNDEIDFVCPYFQDDSDNSEYYIIYQVTQREYSDCNIYTSTTANMIVNCSTPRQRKRFTIIFETYSAIPNGQEFRQGGTYYYITTSSGKEEGLTNQHQGACISKNMRLTIKVCCDTKTNAPTTHRFISPATSSNSTFAPGELLTEPTVAGVSTTRDSNPESPLLTHKPLTKQSEATSTQPARLSSTSTSRYPPDTDPPFAWWKTSTRKPWGDTKWPPGFQENDKKDKEKEYDDENETFPQKEGYTGGCVRHSPSANFLLICVILWTCIYVRR